MLEISTQPRRGRRSTLPALLLLVCTLVHSTVASPDAIATRDLRNEASYFEYVHPELTSTETEAEILSDSSSSAARSLNLRLGAFGKVFEVEASKDRVAYMHPEFKVAALHGDGDIVEEEGSREAIPDCFYRGSVRIDGEESKGQAHMHMCHGGVDAIFRHPSGSFEIQYLQAEKRHVMIDHQHHYTRNGSFSRCGMDLNLDDDGHHSHVHEEHHHHHHEDHHSHHNHPSTSQLDTNIYAQQQTSTRPHLHLQNNNECTNSPEKYIDILFVLDHTLNDFYGSTIASRTHAQNVFSAMEEIYVGGSSNSGIKKSSLFECSVRPRMRGMLSWHGDHPSTVEYKFQDDCNTCLAEQGYPAQACHNKNEVAGICLWKSFGTWIKATRSDLEQIFGEIDFVFLLTTQRFNNGILGLASYNALCTEEANSISRVDASSLSAAETLAHELGHAFGMTHTSGVMNAYSIPGVSMSEFSDASRTEINNYFEASTGLYCGSRYECNGRCLDNAPALHTSVCGNGFVEAGEECDPGYGNFDHCCSSDCRDLGCVCSDSDGTCCYNGQFRPSTYVCNEAKDSQCDVPEYCTGSSAACPMDRFKSSLAACTSSTVQNTNGRCREGECRYYGSNCPDSHPVVGTITDVCQATVKCYNCDISTCGGASPESCGACTDFIESQTANGVPCGSGEQECVFASFEDATQVMNGECTGSNTLRIYRLDFSSCPSGPYCVDEEGITVNINNCISAGITYVPCPNSFSPTTASPVSPTTASPATNSPTVPTTSPRTAFPTESPSTVTPSLSPTTSGPHVSTGSPFACIRLDYGVSVDVTFQGMSYDSMAESEQSEFRAQFKAAIVGAVSGVNECQVSIQNIGSSSSRGNNDTSTLVSTEVRASDNETATSHLESIETHKSQIFTPTYGFNTTTFPADVSIAAALYSNVTNTGDGSDGDGTRTTDPTAVQSTEDSSDSSQDSASSSSITFIIIIVSIIGGVVGVVLLIGGLWYSMASKSLKKEKKKKNLKKNAGNRRSFWAWKANSMGSRGNSIPSHASHARNSSLCSSELESHKSKIQVWKSQDLDSSSVMVPTSKFAMSLNTKSVDNTMSQTLARLESESTVTTSELEPSAISMATAMIPEGLEVKKSNKKLSKKLEWTTMKPSKIVPLHDPFPSKPKRKHSDEGFV